MNKTALRARLADAINAARDLKNYGLKPSHLWDPITLRRVARKLREAADAIDQYLVANGEIPSC